MLIPISLLSKPLVVTPLLLAPCVTGAATLSSSLAVSGAAGVDGDFDVNTNKFTVEASSGNTAVAGTKC